MPEPTDLPRTPADQPGALHPSPRRAEPGPTSPARAGATVLANQVSEEGVYRPISGLALVGFILAVVYAVVVVLFGAAAFYQGQPLLLGSLNFLVVAGVVLCLAGWVHISRSEGTRAGRGLARVGLLVGLAFGLGYLAYYGATYFAIREQADKFAREWLALLQEGKANAAFLRSMEPAIRQGVNPDDERAMEARFNQGMPSSGRQGPLSTFRNGELTQIIMQGGADTQITPRGVEEWGYSKSGGYKVRREYLLEVPEGHYRIALSVQGRESRTQDFDKRQWSVELGDSRILSQQPTELGKERNLQRAQVQLFLESWQKKLLEGRIGDAYLDVCDPADRQNVALQFEVRRTAAELALGTLPCGTPVGLGLAWAASANSDTVGRLFMPGFTDAAKRLVEVDTSKMRLEDEAILKAVQSGAQTLFDPAHAAHRLLGLRLTSRELARWTLTKEGRLQFVEKVQLGFAPGYSCDAVVLVEGDPHLAAEKKLPEWRVAKLTIQNATDASRERGPPMADVPLPAGPPAGARPPGTSPQ